MAQFLRSGCELLWIELLGFGAEKQNAAADALVYLILGLVGEVIEEQKVQYL